MRQKSTDMQNLLFRRVELWLVLLLVLAGIVGAVGFASVVLGAAEHGRYGAVGKVAVAVAETPATLRRLLSPDDSLVVYRSERFDAEPTGWSYPSGDPSRLPDGYLLLSRYDGTLRQHVIELTRLRDGSVVHRWTPDADALLDGVSRASSFSDYANWDRAHFREIHPWLTPDGGLIVKDHFSPLFRLDACGRREWVIDDRVFHHSTEPDADGNLWLPTLVEPHTVAKVRKDFFEDGIAAVSPDGKVLFERSLTAKLLEDGYGPVLFANGRYHVDPTHLNDVEPVLADGPYWKKGDLFLSLRNLSMILLYRPSTDRILWTKTAPWASQHDVDLLDDHRIAVYDNDVEDRGGLPLYDGASEVMVYDFATGAVTSPWKAPFETNAIRTYAAGLFTALPGGYALVEDVTEARLLVLAPDGSVAARYVNRAEDGRIYHLGWSRYLDKAPAEAVLSKLEKVKCDD